MKREVWEATGDGDEGEVGNGKRNALIILSMYQFVLVLILMTAVFGQTSSVPYDSGGPEFTNSEEHVSYSGSYSSIRSVNFRNFTFHTAEWDAITLKNGRYKHDESLVHQAIALESVIYLGRPASSKDESVLVLLSWFAVGGSSSQGGIAQVFTLSNGHLQMIQEMGWDTHFQAGQPTDSFDPNSRTLLVRTAHYIPGDAHCCVSAMDVVTLQWNGTRFAQTDLQTELSQYDKEQGKTLPH